MKPESQHQKFLKLSNDTGIPVATIWSRYNAGKPLDAPVTRTHPCDEDNAAARRVAIRGGKMKFVGSPCRQCGNVVRYTSSGGCVLCRRTLLR